MRKSSRLGMGDYRRVHRLAGECRELGADVAAWHRHLVAGLSGLTGEAMGFAGELADFHLAKLKHLGMTDWGWPTDSDRALYMAGTARLLRESEAPSTLVAYQGRWAADDGVCLSRRQLFTDRQWLATPDYEFSLRPIRVSDVLWCIRTIPGAWDGGAFGVVLHRPAGSGGFRERDRALVREAMAAVAPLAGGALARFADPSPSALAPRMQAVLRCLLEGDSDKQIAARLRLSPYTVNQYTKGIYRHFRSRGRIELMALWIRRGWGLPPVPPPGGTAGDG